MQTTFASLIDIRIFNYPGTLDNKDILLTFRLKYF